MEAHATRAARAAPPHAHRPGPRSSRKRHLARWRRRLRSYGATSPKILPHPKPLSLTGEGLKSAAGEGKPLHSRRVAVAARAQAPAAAIPSDAMAAAFAQLEQSLPHPKPLSLTGEGLMASGEAGLSTPRHIMMLG